MPFDLADFVAIRPFLYHLTARSNVASIISSHSLKCAAKWLEESKASTLASTKRDQSTTVYVDGQSIHIRDQIPLHSGNLSLTDGWVFADFIMHLNKHVFFWPGKEEGPIPAGRNHFRRYCRDDAVVLRVPTAATISLNPEPPLLCRFNSGSPRCSNGKKPPRGPDTFVPASRFDGRPSDVVEVVFLDEVVLPADCIEELKVKDLVGQ